MRRINSVLALLFGTEFSGFTQSLTLAWLPMVCLMPYWSSSEFWWLRLLKISLGSDSLRELAAREISLLMLASPSEDTASMAFERVLGYACLFTGCSEFISVACIWPLLSALTRKLPPSLI